MVLRHQFWRKGGGSVGCFMNCSDVWVRLICGALASVASNARAIFGRSGWYFVVGVRWGNNVGCCCRFVASDGEEGGAIVGCDVQCDVVWVR